MIEIYPNVFVRSDKVSAIFSREGVGGKEAVIVVEGVCVTLPASRDGQRVLLEGGVSKSIKHLASEITCNRSLPTPSELEKLFGGGKPND